jgi:DNA polymerase-3 subunit gamma/tau
VREGDVLPERDVEPSIEPDDSDDDELEAAASDSPVPPSIAPPLAVPERSTARASGGAAKAGPQRYGEAVVRQVLGAAFVREEPYEPPTRFS